MNPPLSAPSTKVNRRQKADVLKLINSKYQIEFSDESKMNDFFIKFRGPEGTHEYMRTFMSINIYVYIFLKINILMNT